MCAITLPECSSAEPSAGLETLTKTALDFYLAAITAISECLEAIAPDLARPHVERLGKLRKRLTFQPTIETLQESAETLESELATVAGKFCDSRDLRGNELRDILLLAARMEDLLALRKRDSAEHMRQFSRQVEQAEATGDRRPGRQSLTQ